MARHLARRGFLCASAAGALLPAVAGAGESKARGVRIAHLADPQFGFGPTKPEESFERKYSEDLCRFERVIDKVNDLKPDVALIAGDMTHVPEHLVRDWPRLLGRFKVPVVAVPGNHDVGIPLLRRHVERFRQVFGRDYAAVDVNGWRLVAGNSQYWYATDDAPELKRAYGEWLGAELEKARGYAGRVILASHISPFAYRFNEGDSYESCPQKDRGAKLAAYRAAGARFYLAGHMHRMCARAYGDLTILTAETTCGNFDEAPFGFRLFEAGDDFSSTWHAGRVDA